MHFFLPTEGYHRAQAPGTDVMGDDTHGKKAHPKHKQMQRISPKSTRKRREEQTPSALLGHKDLGGHPAQVLSRHQLVNS